MKILVESNFPTHLVNALEAKEHEMSIGEVLYGGTESRTDGSVAVY